MNVHLGITWWSPHIVTLYEVIITLYNNYSITVIYMQEWPVHSDHTSPNRVVRNVKYQ